MTETQAIVLIVITSMSLLTSAACLSGMIVGAKKVTDQVEAAKTKADAYKKKVSTFLATLDD